jgi:hypothetical protein
MGAVPETECQALPLAGQDHDGPIRGYVRICPGAHFRPGNVCESCAGNGAIMCDDCPGEGPAILLLAEIWHRLVVEDVWGRLAAESTRELTAEGTGPLLDPDCRAGKCGSCIGPPCEHGCHQSGS